jgi:hypothetical protein
MSVDTKKDHYRLGKFDDWLILLLSLNSQLYENYRRKNTDGVSIPFLLLWIFGDIFNLLGAILEHLMLTVVNLKTNKEAEGDPSWPPPLSLSL